MRFIKRKIPKPVPLASAAAQAATEAAGSVAYKSADKVIEKSFWASNGLVTNKYVVATAKAAAHATSSMLHAVAGTTRAVESWTVKRTEANRPVMALARLADKVSGQALMFAVNNTRKIQPGIVASAMATPLFNFCARRRRSLRRIVRSEILKPIRVPIKMARRKIRRKVRGLWRNPRYKHFTVPVGGVLAVLSYTIKDFFRDAPEPAFFNRALKYALIIGVLAVGVPMALGMGLSVAQMMAVGALQIPLGVFQKSMENAVKQYVPTEDLNHRTVVRYRKQLLVLGCTAAFGGALLYFSPWLRLATGGLALSAIQNLLQDTSKDLAKDHTKKAFEAQAVSGGMRILTNEQVLAPFAGLSPEQRREVLEQLKERFKDDFDAVATRAEPPPVQGTFSFPSTETSGAGEGAAKWRARRDSNSRPDA